MFHFDNYLFVTTVSAFLLVVERNLVILKNLCPDLKTLAFLAQHVV